MHHAALGVDQGDAVVHVREDALALVALVLEGLDALVQLARRCG